MLDRIRQHLMVSRKEIVPDGSPLLVSDIDKAFLLSYYQLPNDSSSLAEFVNSGQVPTEYPLLSQRFGPLVRQVVDDIRSESPKVVAEVDDYWSHQYRQSGGFSRQDRDFSRSISIINLSEFAEVLESGMPGATLMFINRQVRRLYESLPEDQPYILNRNHNFYWRGTDLGDFHFWIRDMNAKQPFLIGSTETLMFNPLLSVDFNKVLIVHGESSHALGIDISFYGQRSFDLRICTADDYRKDNDLIFPGINPQDGVTFRGRDPDTGILYEERLSRVCQEAGRYLLLVDKFIESERNILPTPSTSTTHSTAG